jgi:F-type H+-transporting ATPase subunit b
MDQMLQALAGILLKSVPTICLLLLLYFYFKGMLFGPLNRILKQRHDLTIGTRKAADQSLQDAERRVEGYEGKIREARAEVYREQEITRAQWLTDQAGQLATARERTGAATAKAKEQLQAEVATARQTLVETSGALADEIATVVLSRRAG